MDGYRDFQWHFRTKTDHKHWGCYKIRCMQPIDHLYYCSSCARMDPTTPGKGTVVARLSRCLPKSLSYSVKYSLFLLA